MTNQQNNKKQTKNLKRLKLRAKLNFEIFGFDIPKEKRDGSLRVSISQLTPRRWSDLSPSPGQGNQQLFNCFSDFMSRSLGKY